VTVRRCDALVIGAGPAGSVAALVLARGGARVALVDKARFPRDKACGDLVGPRGVQVLYDLGVHVGGRRVGDMEVVGPSGGRVVLPASPGSTYPGYGIVASRRHFDDALRQAALNAGATAVTGRAATPLLGDDGGLHGFEVETEKGGPLRLVGDVVIGADGALSRVAAAAGLVNESQVLWAFAVRTYLPGAPLLPSIHFWEPQPWAGYPGYGWVFPGEDGLANVGLGVGRRGDRRAGARASRDLEGFVSYAGWKPATVGRTLGGWLKLGIVGTTPVRGRVLLVGDAAGLVNSLQGEGISQALASGRAAAAAVLGAGAAGAAELYRDELARLYARYASTATTVTGWMLSQPKVIAGLGRLLTAPGLGRALAPAWAVYWNDLLDGARPGWPRRAAGWADAAGRVMTAAARDRALVWAELRPADAAPPAGCESL
jgi:geranylgeranyl reductase family protein